jgi:hypothetical protein
MFHPACVRHSRSAVFFVARGRPAARAISLWVSIWFVDTKKEDNGLSGCVYQGLSGLATKSKPTK